ncbi:hypothetical protein PMI07_006573 [Rhizobium sp. CF080]|uniref:hypothetical protein n=1 Tax=Rhizobium sp. (strain CF080) TaxID=1144310 RepID=UPI000271CE2C|nr:hypothetical protein [Rhizobium sp. CF080]EUB98259.1 hypothetical protein PMI07_006573 [Rhizobium sp. CF080]
MADFDRPVTAASTDVNDLPNEMLHTIVRHTLDQKDGVAAFCEINALRATSPRFRALIEGDPVVRSGFRALRSGTEFARFEKAMNEVLDSRRTISADEIITYYNVTISHHVDTIRLAVGMRDIDANPEMVARTAIERNGVNEPSALKILRSYAARRDIRANPKIVAQTAIDRNEVVDPIDVSSIRWLAENPALDSHGRAPLAGHAPGTPCKNVTQNTGRGLDERSRQDRQGR